MPSESSIIEKLKKQLPPYGKDVLVGIGDDAAVLKSRTGECLLVTTDAQVEGVHFLRDQVSVVKIGEKVVLAAISDISAMGGNPAHMLVSLIIPHLSSRAPKGRGDLMKRHSREGGNLEPGSRIKSGMTMVDKIYDGIIVACRKYHVDIIGGNISRGKELSITITVLGFAKPGEVVLRSGAKVGDMVLVTGTLGDAPVPRVAEGLIIGKSKLASAMIDVSDGLSTDLLHICDASGVGVKIFVDQLPVASSSRRHPEDSERSVEDSRIPTGFWTSQNDGFETEVDLALNGGEDYELLFTANAKNAKELINLVKRETGTQVAIIGEILKKSEGRWIVDGRGKKIPLLPKGWDHFRKLKTQMLKLKSTS